MDTVNILGKGMEKMERTFPDFCSLPSALITTLLITHIC